MKSGSLPARLNVLLQRDYYNNVLRPLIQKAKKYKVVLLFLDGSHFVMGGDFLGYIYGTVRRYIKTFSGRKRYSVLGALNFSTKKITTISTVEYISAVEVCEMLKKVSIEYAGKPIHIVLDNARYQKCTAVKDLAKELSIILEYLPPYSPNMNAIERFWKHVKSRLRSQYYDQFDAFKETIDFIIEDSDKGSKTVMDKLIGERVQVFDNLFSINDNTFIANKASLS